MRGAWKKDTVEVNLSRVWNGENKLSKIVVLVIDKVMSCDVLGHTMGSLLRRYM